MKYNWDLLTIDEVCSITDCQHKTAPTLDYPSEYRMLRTVNVRNGQLKDIDSTKSVSKEIYDQWSARGYLEPGDVILTREAPMGEVALLRENEKYKFFLGQRILQLKAFPDIISPEFLYYSLQTKELRHQIMMNEGTGSVVSNIRIPLLKKIKILVPPLSQQKNITKILIDIDDKILLNKKIISKLERIAQTLFKRWFIDFDFPNMEELPYKTNGGSMKEIDLRELPSSWTMGTLGDIAYQKNKKINLDTALTEYNYIGLEHMPQGSIELSSWESSNKVSGSKNFFKNDDILFGKLRPYFKKVGIAPIEGVCSTDILVLNTEKKYFKSYLFLNLIQENFIQYTSNTATGTRMPRTSWNSMSQYKIPLPDEHTCNKFEYTVSPMLQKINHLIHENNNLQMIRDTLLPKIFSNETEIQKN